MISDTSPLIFLSKINALNLLRELYTSIIIPEAVKKEVYEGNRDDTLAITKAIEEGWIKTENSQEELTQTHDKGENAAINLANEKKEPLLIDDAKGIKIAKTIGIEVYRTTTIILHAVQKKIVAKNESLKLIKNLVEQNYYIAPAYYAQLLEKLLK